MSTMKAACATALMLAAATSIASASSFVYVSVPGVDCVSQPETAPPVCRIPPAVVVVDAATSLVVTRIPLETSSAPSGLQLSRDGSRLFALNGSMGGPVVLTAIDARLHRRIATYTLPVPPYCTYYELTIDTVDPERVYVRRDCSPQEVAAIDARSGAVQTILALAPRGGGGTQRSPLGGRFLLTTWSTQDGYNDLTLDEYRGSDGGQTASLRLPTDVNFAWNPGVISSDGTALFMPIEKVPLASPKPYLTLRTGSVLEIDPRTMVLTGRYEVPDRLPLSVLHAAATGRLYVADVTRSQLMGESSPRLHVFDTATRALVRTVEGHPGFLAIRADGRRAFGPAAAGSKALLTWDLSSITAVASTPLQADARGVVTTPPGVQTCDYRVDSSHVALPVDSSFATIALTTACAWEASSGATWVRPSMPSGVGNASLSLTVDRNDTIANRAATVNIGGQPVLVTQAGLAAGAPFGTVDTPFEGVTGVSGALPVTGWAIDDVGVARVRVYRDSVPGEFAGPIYIGQATFVAGARPDVDRAYAGWPDCSRAGWGLMVLTNMLPGANGTFRLTAIADDVEGHQTVLGARSFTADNDHAIRPFGTIDTPREGETVHGTILNFGWALTGRQAQIPADGSTIDILVDGTFVGHPAYGNYRSDIATLFPGYANSNGAVGWFELDTTRYANGVHTIWWVVRDTAGNAAGLGSRYFTIDNR